ncbi:cupin domain-containing protein [Nisaea sp.]|uniref:JmjC domain-containing protein n=1 Tax=Nisaea sp. TaxID=2024842 RepID=UPI0032ECD449
MQSGFAKDGRSFAWLIHPIDIETFFRDYFEQKPLHVTGRSLDYYAEIFRPEDMEDILWRNVHSPSIAVASKMSRAISAPISYVGTSEPWWPGEMYKDRHALIINGIQKHIAGAGRFLRGIEKFFKTSGHLNLYANPANCQGFPPHFDSHDTLILHIEGIKRWMFYGQHATNPVHTQLDSKLVPPSGDPEMELELAPGDFLYIPRGHVHAASTSDSPSKHLTLGLFPSSWRDLMDMALATSAEYLDDSLRASIPLDASRETIATTLKEHFLALAQRCNDDVFVEQARTRLLLNTIDQMQALPDHHLERFDDAGTLNEDSIIRKRDSTLCAAFMHQGEAFIRFPTFTATAMVKGPAFIFDTLKFVEETEDPFRISEMAGSMNSRSKLILARRLMTEGLLALPR